MDKIKKISLIAVVMAVIFTLSVVFIVFTKNDKDSSSNESTVVEFVYEKTEDGKYVYFGEYPQSLKDENVTVSEVADKDGYYLGSDGEKYLKYTLNVDFEDSMGYTLQEATELKFLQAKNGINMENEKSYYFKIEKLKWRILNEENGEALIVCDTIIQGGYFQEYCKKDVDDKYYVTDEEGQFITNSDGVTKIYANNYEYSSLRKFLINDFYNKAFTIKQKEKIVLTVVDNSAKTTISTSNIYACENTSDYVFTLSYADARNSKYGFSRSNSDINKKWNTTDFAKATNALTTTKEYVIDQGVEEGSSQYNTLSPFMESGLGWLRSPYNVSNKVSRVSFGNVGNGVSLSANCGGIIPALQIKF